MSREILTKIVKRAMKETVTSIGQITPAEKLELNRAIRAGYLVKGKGGPFPMVKTVYAVPTFDFALARQMHVAFAMEISSIEAK